jgi:hypothetical protein
VISGTDEYLAKKEAVILKSKDLLMISEALSGAAEHFKGSQCLSNIWKSTPNDTLSIPIVQPLLMHQYYFKMLQLQKN